MEMFLESKKSKRVISGLLIAALVLYAVVVRPDSVYAVDEVTSLPAGINVSVEYDADTISLSYAGSTYSIDRNHSVLDENGKFSYLTFGSLNLSTQTPLYDTNSSCRYSFPISFEKDYTGHPLATSYWYSPSKNKVFVFYSLNYALPSQFNKVPEPCSRVLSYDALSHKIRIESLVAFTYTMSFMSVVDLDSNVYFEYPFQCDIGKYKDYIDIASYGIEPGGNAISVPSDLLCIFANHEISGFYEPDTSKVATPDYYFNWQYIFYCKNFGYVFIDSAEKLTSVGFPNGVTNPYFYFFEECNFYAYTSSDGITWSQQTTISTMYDDTFSVSTSVTFSGNYELVYSNDSGYGEEPLIPPEYGDITDVIGTIYDFSGDIEDIIFYDDVETEVETEYFSGVNKFLYTLVSGLTSKLGLGGVYDYIASSIKGDEYTYSLSEYLLTSINSELTNFKVYEYVDWGDGTASYVGHTTILGYVSEIYRNLYDIKYRLDVMVSGFDASLKSIFDNITLTNRYLDKINSSIGSIKIPDYSGSFSVLEEGLATIHDDLNYNNYSASYRLATIQNYMLQTRNFVDSIDSSLRLDNGSGVASLLQSVYAHEEQILTAINSLPDALSVSLGSASGSITFDDTGIIDALSSGFDELHGDLVYLKTLLTVDTVLDLFDDDESPGVGSFVSSGISTLASGTVISGALAFLAGTTGGITFINSYVSKFYAAVPELIPVFTVGASFFVIDLVLRRKS